MTDYRLESSSDATATPKRLAVLRPETAARVLIDRDETVMTAPHLLLREVIMVQVCVIVMALLSLFFDAPLEGIADPTNTPNPAKAPWYFLGLQELLHYFPPVVAGVLIPGLVVMAMVVIPYFTVNLDRRGFLEGVSRRRMLVVNVLMAAIGLFLAVWHVWAVLIPTLLVYASMTLPLLPPCPPVWRRWLVRVSLSDWIMTWFVVVAVVLTLIGTFFRGPGWKWIWPWHGRCQPVSAPRPSTDRLWFWFAVSSVSFFAVLAVSPVKDYFREYRRYQNEYRQQLLRSATSLKEVKQAHARPVAEEQIWLPALNDHVDRCVSCHLGTDEPRMAGAPEPFRRHPRTPHTPGDIDRFGCVACHLGQGRATTVAEAHGRVPDWNSPILPVRYTEASCGRCHLGDTVPEASLLSEGRALMTQVGCFGCHAVAGHEKWKSEAPDLAGLSQKTNPAWIKAWIKSPRSLRPATWMPDFRLSDAEIDSVVAFVWSRPPRVDLDTDSTAGDPTGDPDHGKHLFSVSRCISCHTIEGRGNGSAPELYGVGSKVTRRWLIAFLADPQRFYPDTKMPRYHFSRRDVADLADYMLQELTESSAPGPAPGLHSADRVIQAGEKIFRRVGCNGCHEIARKKMGAAIGPELTGIADKPVGRLDFGRRSDLPRALPDWLAAKVTDPRSFRDGLKMPRFGFTKHQAEALTTALLSLGREPVPVDYQVPVTTASYTPPGRFGELVRQYRCLSCHQIDGVGGNISTAPLTDEGSKVHPGWLAEYLKLPTTVRPIVEERMLQLQMPDDQRAFIANFVENVLRNDSIPDEIFLKKPAAEDVERGRKLFHERYGCQACHMVGGQGGFYGPVLDGVGVRLKTGWIYTWLKGPQHLKADSQEPDYGLDDDDARALTAYVASIPALSTSGGKK